MSEHTWSADEGDMLDNIDKHVQLVSTSSSSQSPSSHTKGDTCKSDSNMKSLRMEPLSEGMESNESLFTVLKNPETLAHSRQSFTNFNCPGFCDVEQFLPDGLSGAKLHNSCNDLSLQPGGNFDGKGSGMDLQSKQLSFKRSASCASLTGNEKPRRGKYDHVQSKIKQYFSDVKKEVRVMPEVKREPHKEEYLEEINKRLTRELDEKNAMLAQLQENYEHLLLKYAEAQNRIDQLRFKTISVSGDCTSRSGFKSKSSRTSIRVPLSFYNQAKEEQDGKCQKAIVAPFMKAEEVQKRVEESSPVPRPMTLPIDSGLKVMDREAMKAPTPTDSEGVSSVITSMSGHSKILNTLDEETLNREKKGEEQVDYSANFILEGGTLVNDAYDKVKNWQNSLPPLELIETPETTLYDLPPPGNMETDVSPSTNYNELTEFVEEGKVPNSTQDDFPPSDWPDMYPKSEFQKNKFVSQAVMKKYLRTLSLPCSLSKRNIMSLIYKRKNHHTIDISGSVQNNNNAECKDSALNLDNVHEVITEETADDADIPAACIIRKHHKKPPFLRSASLPIYDYDSPKSGGCRNDVFIPSLDLENLTISDDATSPEMAYNLSKSNMNTSPSFLTSRGDSADCSFQTLQSINSCKATVSELSDSPFARGPRPTFHKSTSITPDRSKEMIFPVVYEFKDPSEYSEPEKCSPATCESFNEEKTKNWCNVCGETLAEQRFADSCKAASFQNVHFKESSVKRRTKHPFNRSVSFNSENNSPSFCFPEGDGNLDSFSPRNSFHRRSQESLEQFELYTNNLKTRSQVIMKALTAHVNNS